jgi:hypothetical protein
MILAHQSPRVIVFEYSFISSIELLFDKSCIALAQTSQGCWALAQILEGYSRGPNNST